MIRIATAALLLSATASAAQQAVLHDPLLDALQGRWVITGTVAGERTTDDLAAEWVLNHQYLRLHEVSRGREKDGRPRYEAFVHIGWNEKTASYGCVWLDDFGGLNTQSVGAAAKSADRLAFVFANLDGSRTRTTMTYRAKEKQWSWTIDEDRAGTLSRFADLTLSRAAGD